MEYTTNGLVKELLEGNRRAMSRLITLVENNSPSAVNAIQELYPYTGNAITVGITGPPGAGKSTLVNQLAKEFRKRDKTVGIIAVDPSSPFTQGAILGDRVRMQELIGDPNVFVRSMASRGAMGGLSDTTIDVIAVLDAFGKDIILVETVGVGQDEVEVMRAVQTVIVVGVPGTGDAIQALKAGILEIANIYVVNKADREGADQAVSYLKQLLSLEPKKAKSEWRTPVLKTVAMHGDGVPELTKAIEAHHTYLSSTGKGHEEEAARIRHQVLTLAQRELYSRLSRSEKVKEVLAEKVQAILRREANPYRTARELADLAVESESPGYSG
ncbi:MAG: methylmalonyl Co-A mutase-associated GTPase MeaB [Dehalococcoidia bacterium]|nr:methylmalonyl Co-A mutase-associated GTPase MeaB [Dehalococcoidia bacterium]